MPFRMNHESVLLFGKYKGKTGDEVARTNPGYVCWVDREVQWVEVCPELRRLAVSVGISNSEHQANTYGDHGDFGFSAF